MGKTYLLPHQGIECRHNPLHTNLLLVGPMAAMSFVGISSVEDWFLVE